MNVEDGRKEIGRSTLGKVRGVKWKKTQLANTCLIWGRYCNNTGTNS